MNISDRSLIRDTIANGGMNESVSNRLKDYIKQAETAGVDAIIVTCSSLGPAVEESQSAVSIPLIRVDSAMVNLAVKTGSRIGVLATVSTTLKPTVELIERRAKQSGKKVEVTSCLCHGALEKLLAGEVDEHDQMVIANLLGLISTVDVVVLAQASMARVIQCLPHSSCKIPILSSPRLAIESLAKQFRRTA
ncbi:MAG: aspartate/glutamate racemase family protein [Pirellulales bacterium]